MRALYHGADLGDPKQIAGLVETAIGTFGGVDILVNNAVVRYFAPLEQFKPENWDHALAVNLSAAFHTTRLVLPGMRKRNFGRIVNISSIFGLRGTVNRVDYVTTKTALIGFTRAIALETAGQDITCNAICPGACRRPRSSSGSPSSWQGRPAARRGGACLHVVAPAVGALCFAG